MSVDAVDLDDGHVVAFEPHILSGKGTDVDHPHKVSLPRLEGHLQVLGVVEEGRLRHRLGTAGVLLAHEEVDQAGHLVVVPVGYADDNLLVVLVLVRVLGVVHNERTSYSIWVLALAVRVVPIRARLVDLLMFSRSHLQWWIGRSYHKVICEPRAGRNCALGDLDRAVHVRAAIHEQPVEVQRRRLVPQRVEDVNDQPIADIDLDEGEGPLTVDANDRPVCFAIWIGRDPADVEVVGYCCRQGERDARQQKGEREEETAETRGSHCELN